MRDIDVRQIDLKKMRVSRRTVVWVCLTVAMVAGAFLAWRYINHPPRPWLVRWRLEKYLAKQAHTSDFKTEFPFPAKNEMTKGQSANDNIPTKGSRTGKDFETLREEYIDAKLASLALLSQVKRSEASLAEAKPKLEALTKELANAQAANNETNTALVVSNSTALRHEISGWEKTAARRTEVAAKDQEIQPVVDDLWEFQKAWAANEDDVGSAALVTARIELIKTMEESIRGASSYDSMYRSIGQELFVAGKLQESGNPEHRRQGVLIALAAARQSVSQIKNGLVAARICEGYVLPHLDLATDRNPRSTFNEENLLGQCTDYFRQNDEFNNIVRTYRIALGHAKSPEQKDRLRSQIVRACEQAGDAKGALAAIREIKDTNAYRGLVRRIPQLEQDAKYQK
jgi:hypothetical protein